MVRPLVHFQHVFHLGDIVVIEIATTTFFPATASDRLSRRIRMVSLPTRGTTLRLTLLPPQAYCPTSAAFRWATAYHGNQTLFLAIVEYLRCSGRCLSYSARSKPPADNVATFRMACGVSAITPAMRGAATPCQLQKAKARNTTRTCCTPPSPAFGVPSDLWQTVNTQGWPSHTLVCVKTFLIKTVFLPNLQASEPSTVTPCSFCMNK